MSKTINKKDLPKFLEKLKSKFEVYAPIKTNGNYLFKNINDIPIADIELNYSTTLTPPKNIFFPYRETYFEIKNGKRKQPKFSEKTLVFGIHIPDIHGLLFLDDVFGGKEKDFYYFERRKNTVVIGVNHTSRTPTFHEALGLDVHAGYDLFLDDIGENYLAIPESKKGNELINNALFKNSDWHEGITKSKIDPLLTDTEKLSLLVEKSANDKIWDDLAKICFGCGNCSFVCPCCYCFETCDNIDFDGTIKRQRRWDSCFLPNFSEMTGINTRKRLRERIYHWYYHKFVQLPKTIGKIGCVGCGRCIAYCPAKINFRKVLAEIERKYG